MIRDDRVQGKPLRPYIDTEANIEALVLGAADEGCVAYATDTNELGTYDGSAWSWITAAAAGAAGTVSQLSDVEISGLSDRDFLQYDQASTDWLNRSPTESSAQTKTGWDPGVEAEVTMSWDDGTRTLTLTPANGSYSYWINGIRYTKSAADSAQITDTEGWWYIYYSGSTLTASQVAWSIADDNRALVAFVYWDAVNNKAIGGSARYEMHGWKMDAATHKWGHESFGTRFETGLAVSENPADQLEVAAGEIHDEDIEVEIADGAGAGLWEQDLSPLQAYKVYKDGANGYWRHGGAYGTTPVVLDGGNDVQWNEFVGGAWQLTAAGANQYSAYWVIATSDIHNPVFIMMGQGSPNANIDTARESNEIEGLDLGLLGPEYKILVRAMVRNIGGGVFYEVSAIDDYRAAQLIPSSNFVATDHGALASRASDTGGHPALYMLNWDNVLIVHPAGDTRTGQYFTTITAALAAASSGDTILVMPGTYAEDFAMVAGVAVVGLSRDKVIISGAGGATVVTVAVANAVLANLTVESTSTENSFVGVGVSAGAADFVTREVTVSVTTSGAAAYGFLLATAAAMLLEDCAATAVGAATGYGVYANTVTTTVSVLGGEYVGSTTNDVRTVSGTTNISFVSYGSVGGAVTLADAAEILASLLTVDGTGSSLDADTVDGRHAISDVTRTVGAGKDHATIQAAINWFAERVAIFGDNVIDADAAAYDEAVSFSDIVLAAGATLTLEGDTRALVGISYVDGASCNQAAIANGGSGVCALANAGNNITVTGTVGNPDYDAAGLVNGDRILVYDNAGATTIETIDSVLNNVITLTGAAPAVGNDATSICILPDRSIERTAAGPCIQVSSIRGVSIDGWYLESAAGASCHGIAADTAALVVAENTATNVEDNGIWADAAYSTIRSVGGAVSCWGSTHAARATSAAQVILNYGVSVACTTGFSCAFFGFFFGTRMTAVEATTGFTATHFSYLYAGFGTARQDTTGYYAGQRGYLYAAASNVNNNGNGADYNPAVSDAFGNNNGSITWS